MRDALYSAVQNGMGEVRDGLLGIAAEGHSPAVTSPAGFLLRSKNITNWPGLEVTAQSSPGVLMKPLRLDRLGDDLMLVIFPDIPVQVALTQPSEGLVFGQEDNGIEMRYIPGVTGYSSTNIGSPIGGNSPLFLTSQQVMSTARSSTGLQGPAPLNISGRAGLAAVIQGILPGNPVLTPASLAVEMVRVPEQMVFTPLQLQQ